MNSDKLKILLKNHKKNIIYLSISIFLVIVLYFAFFKGIDSSGVIPSYKVKKDKFLISLTEAGELRAKKSTGVSAPRIRGSLKIIYLIPEGTYVQEGDVVMKFDPSEVSSKLVEAESQYEIALSEKEKLLANHKSSNAQMEANLKSAELSFELSKLNIEQIKFEAEAKQRETKLQHEKNKIAYEQTKQEYESKKIIQKSELSKVDLEIKQKKNDLEKVQRDYESLTVTAPSEGLVVYAENWANGNRKFQVGDSPWGGMVVINLPDLSKMESVTTVNEVDVSRVKEGLKVEVTLDAFRDTLFSGIISKVASLGKNKDGSNNIKVFEILVDIEGNSELLKPGMSTSNKIIVNEIENVTFVPYESVFEKGESKVVYKKTGLGVSEIIVELGEKGEDFIIVKGLNDGDEILLRDPNIDIEKSLPEETEINE